MNLAAAGREHLAVRQNRGVHEPALRRHRLRRRHDRRAAGDVDHQCAAGVAAELQDAARAEHRRARVAGAIARSELADAGDRAGPRRVDVVHAPAAVVAEDAAVGRDEVARIHEVERAGVGTAQQSERAVERAHFRAVGTARSALDIHLAVQQHRRAGVPARAVHVVAAVQHAARKVENVAVVVAGVGGAGAGPVVAAREEHLPALRQHDLRAAEEVGRRDVVEREVPAFQAGVDVPDVVDEVAGLARDAVGAVGHDAHVRRDHRVHGYQWPGVELGIPGSNHVIRPNERTGKQSERGAGQCARRTAGTKRHSDPG